MDKKDRLSRRDFMRLSGVAATGALVAACAPQVVEKIVKETVEVEVEVEKIVEVEVEKEVEIEKEVEVEKIVEVEAQDMWVTGMVDSAISGPFKIMSWEVEWKVRPFLMHVDRFFSNYYPNIEVEFEWGVPWGEYWAKLPTLLAAGTPPDMAWQHQSRGEVFPSKGWSVCLDDYIDAYPPDGWPDDWWEASVRTMSYLGKIYALPYDWCGRGIYVNREIVDAIQDYPVSDNWTWEDLAELAKATTVDTPEGKQYGCSIGYGASNLWYVASGNGGRLFNDDVTESTFTDPNTVEAAQYLWDLLWKDKVHPTPDELGVIGGTRTGFASGKLAMLSDINAPSFTLDELIGDSFKWGVYPIPMGPGGRYAFGGNSGCFVPTNSGYPDLSYELIRYILSNPELLAATGAMKNAFVSRKSFYKWGLPPSRMLEMMPNFEHVFVELGAENQATFPWWPGYQEWEGIYKKWTDPVFVEGEPGVEEALAGLEEETNEYLASGWWLEE